jgi:ADP-L-glycero-D-manno-heptose 6-epimerase
MIILTGAGGFIGSVMLGYLNKNKIDDVILFDDLPHPDQYKNIINKKFKTIYPHSVYEKVNINPKDISAVIHMGANSNTLEKDWLSVYKTNVQSTRIWNEFCNTNSIPFIFTSTAAVYGNGNGPLNHYAFSKQISEQEINAVVLRLFNVYGPNEYHKGRMASTTYNWFKQLSEGSTLRLFEGSEKYRRDFVWVEDVCKTVLHFVSNYKPGIYDLGTGESVDFDKIANIVVGCAGEGYKQIIPMPDDLKSQYQTDTKADTTALRAAGVDVDLFLEPWQGIDLYWEYLKSNRFY